MARESEEMLYVKVHDAWRTDDRGRPLFAAEVTAAVIYIVRHPLDVAVSCTHHWNMGAAATVKRMCDSGTRLSLTGPVLADQVTQSLGSWSTRRALVAAPVRATLPRRAFTRTCGSIRRPTLAGLVRACGLPEDEDRLRRAVELSDFAELQRQERECGFRAASEPSPVGPFFRRGEVGSWRSELARGRGRAAGRIRARDDDPLRLRRRGRLMDARSVVTRSEDLMSAPVDREIVFLHPTADSYVALDEIGRRVWELIESPRRIAGLVGG